MKIARTKNTVRNIVFGFIYRIINIILPFISRTVILYVMGTQYLGLSSLFTSILSFLSLTELGIGGAMVYSMYKPIAQNDHKSICGLLNLYKRLYGIIGSVVLGLGLLIMPFLKIIIKESLPDGMNIYVLYIIYLINAVLSYWLFAYKNALLQAHQRDDINSKIASVITPMSYAVMLGVLFLTKNYYAYVIWLPIFTIITNIIRSSYVDKNFPNLKPDGEISKEFKQLISKKVQALIGTKLNTVVLNAADNIVMSAFLGLTAIAMYGNYYYIMSSIIGFLGICYSAMTAGLGNSLATETVEKNYNDFKKLSFMNAWLVGWCTVCLICLYQPFMKLWMGEKLMFPFYVVLEFGLYFYIYQIRKIPVTYKDAAGTETVLYSSEVVGGEEDTSKEGEGLHQATNGLEDYFYLGRLSKNEQAMIRLYVQLDGETQGNAYQDTLAKLQMNFAVEGVTTQTVVKTGDQSPIAMISMVALGCAVVLLVLAILAMRMNRKKGAEQ